MNTSEIWTDDYAVNYRTEAELERDSGRKPEEGMEPSPCQVYECSLYEQCKNNAMSCKGFADYIRNGEAREDRIGDPSRKLYLKVFGDPNDEYLTNS